MVSAAVVAITAFGAFSQPAAAQDSTEEPRPATPTFLGDRGIWFVPTGEVLKKGEWSISGYRTDMNRNEGFSNVSFFPFTASVGLGRAEVFGSFRVQTRIDRDTRPLFFPQPPEGGGALYDYPFAREPFSKGVGDLRVGGKFNLLSQERGGGPAAVAVRGMVKLPTASDDDGVGTGKMDLSLDGIVSGEVGRVELSGFGGFVWRDDPDEFRLSNSFRYGFGADFPTRRSLRVQAELFGETPLEDTISVLGAPFLGTDGSRAPSPSAVDSDIFGNIGLTYQHRSGFFVGGALTYRFNTDKRSDVIPAYSDSINDAIGWQVRIGFSPRKSPPPPPAPKPEPPAPPPPPVAPPKPPPPPPAAANRPPTVTVVCTPPQVPVGGTSNCVATAQDPDGDPLTYAWKAPSGKFATPAAATTQWTAGNTPGPVTVTVTVSDGRGGMATGTATIQVVATALEDVLFDFDMSVIRPDQQPKLQAAVAALKAAPGMRLLIEGHCSAEGTMEYNLALGARRASAVLEYLAGQGIDRARLSTVSYGEERPRFPNDTEPNRAMNRRGAFVIQGQ
jgi:peptidoglycan-associated lipoprotein